jgi:hypothetical protein
MYSHSIANPATTPPIVEVCSGEPVRFSGSDNQASIAAQLYAAVDKLLNN